MYDLRQNRQSYVENYELYKRDGRNNADGSRLVYEKSPSCRFVGKVYRQMESSENNISGLFNSSMTVIVVKTPDPVSVDVMDRVRNMESGKKYIVTAVSRDTRKNRFRGRYDKLRTYDTYITMRGE